MRTLSDLLENGIRRDADFIVMSIADQTAVVEGEPVIKDRDLDGVQLKLKLIGEDKFVYMIFGVTAMKGVITPIFVKFLPNENETRYQAGVKRMVQRPLVTYCTDCNSETSTHTYSEEYMSNGDPFIVFYCEKCRSLLSSESLNKELALAKSQRTGTVISEEFKKKGAK